MRKSTKSKRKRRAGLPMFSRLQTPNSLSVCMFLHLCVPPSVRRHICRFKCKTNPSLCYTEYGEEKKDKHAWRSYYARVLNVPCKAHCARDWSMKYSAKKGNCRLITTVHGTWQTHAWRGVCSHEHCYPPSKGHLVVQRWQWSMVQ